ncbi:MAG: hypothetical protein AAGH79_19240 [Bacteroidota bacterium]
MDQPRSFLLIALLFVLSPLAKSNPSEAVQKYLQEKSGLSVDSFYREFPFQALLERVDISQVKLVEEVRKQLENSGYDGNQFVEGLYQTYLEQFPIDLENQDSVKLVFSIAEVLTASEFYLPDSVWQYMGAGMFLLEEMEKKVQAALNEGRLEKEDSYTMYLVNRLGDNDFHLNLPPSNVEKLINYFQNGKYEYIWHKMMTTYRKEFITALVIGLVGLGALVLVIRWLIRRRRRTQN